MANHIGKSLYATSGNVSKYVLKAALICFLKNIFWLCCGILVPWPGIEPAPPALEAQSLNHWTAGEVQH